MSKVLSLLGVSLIIYTWAFLYGASFGAEKACKSIGAEWHENRCVKVTREAMRP